MAAFFISLDMRWRAIIVEWEHPIETNETGKVTETSKLKWSRKEDGAIVGNSRILNILEVAYEGTSKVKMSHLQIMTSRFEALKMSKKETIAEFNV